MKQPFVSLKGLLVSTLLHSQWMCTGVFYKVLLMSWEKKSGKGEHNTGFFEWIKALLVTSCSGWLVKYFN